MKPDAALRALTREESNDQGSIQSRGRNHWNIRGSAVYTVLFAKLPTFTPVTDAVLANPDPADWLMINRAFNQHRFSPLNQINKKNVGQLRGAWTRGLPAGTQETTPIVHCGIIYCTFVPGASVQAVNDGKGQMPAWGGVLSAEEIDQLWAYLRSRADS